MKVSLLVLSILVVGFDAVRIDHKKNEEIQEYCGRKQSSYTRKVKNGELTKQGDHPWAASIYIRVIQNRTSNTYKILMVPGTIISEYHIMTFNPITKINNTLGIVSRERTDLEGTCEGNNMVLPEAMNTKFDFDFEYFENKNITREFKDSIARITIIDGCESLDIGNVMILELKKPLTIGTKEREAACLSNSPDNWNNEDQFAFFGMTPRGRMMNGKLSPVNCSYEIPYSCAKPVEKNQILCQGDYGGSAIAKLNGRYTALGIFVGGNTICQMDPANLPPLKFTNLGYYRQKICDITGVCAPQPSGEMFTTRRHITTTEEPEYTTTPDETAETRTEPLDESAYTRGPEEDTTTTRATTAPRIGAPGEVIVAETYEQMPLGGSGNPEVFNAERIAPMQIGNVTGNGTEIGGIGVNTVNINVIFH